MVSCGPERFQYLGVVYHAIEFVDGSELPSDFFDADAARASLITDRLSSAAAQLGTMFWLGEHPGDWTLAGAEHEADDASVGYTRGEGDNQDVVVLNIRVSEFGGRGCGIGEPEPIPNDPYGGALCLRDNLGDNEYLIVWTQPGFDVWLEQKHYPPDLTREDMLALASSLTKWDDEASGPLLDDEDVRNLVADSLELVCPSKLRQIREARSQSSFDFDRESGEWTGKFGSFGDFAVPDSKPVAIPVSQREEVNSTLSHNAAEFAECIVDEQPPAVEGDDEFGVAFVDQDDSGFSVEVTGVDSEIEAALSFCFLTDGGDCLLTDPDGKRVEMRGAEVDGVRPQVVRIHIVLRPEDLSRSGSWNLVLDLGEGRTAETTFDVE